MSAKITEKWIIDTLLKAHWCIDKTIFIYPNGLQKVGLRTEAGEKICTNVTDALYVSKTAVHFKADDEQFTRLPWSAIEKEDWLPRNKTGYALRFKTRFDEKYIVHLLRGDFDDITKKYREPLPIEERRA